MMARNAMGAHTLGVVRWRRPPAPLATSFDHDSRAASSRPPQKLDPAFPMVTKSPKPPCVAYASHLTVLVSFNMAFIR